MNRSGVAVLSLFVAASKLCAEPDPPDPFKVLRFERWLNEPDQARFRWNVRVNPGDLSAHQRLHARVEIQIDGNEMVSRRGAGALLLMVQFRDGAGTAYQSHGLLSLQEVKDEVAKANVVYSQDAFVVPGDYRVAVGIVDTRNGEHSVVQRVLHVNALKGDPFPEAWSELPAVEFLTNSDAPDAWFQPDVKGKLHVTLKTKRPARIEVLMNASPPPPPPPPIRSLRPDSVPPPTPQLRNRALSNLIPALKLISDVDFRDATLNVTVLDITRRSSIFHQSSVRKLDWPKLRTAMVEADPNKIDVAALAQRSQNAQFFLTEVGKRLEGDNFDPHDSAEAPSKVAAETPCALIVLSGPMSFEARGESRPIESSGKNSCKVFYVRYHATPILPTLAEMYANPLGRRGAFSTPPNTMASSEPFDELAGKLKSLQPRMFDVFTAEQFRKALRQLLDEIANL